jgi:hypothetical protein
VFGWLEAIYGLGWHETQSSLSQAEEKRKKRASQLSQAQVSSMHARTQNEMNFLA